MSVRKRYKKMEVLSGNFVLQFKNTRGNNIVKADLKLKLKHNKLNMKLYQSN